jgi:predicted DCC family thiol-disulfide oxidoreductase YuxK
MIRISRVVRPWPIPVIVLDYRKVRRNKYRWNGRKVMSEYKEEDWQRIQEEREERTRKKMEEEFDGSGCA